MCILLEITGRKCQSYLTGMGKAVFPALLQILLKKQQENYWCCISLFFPLHVEHTACSLWKSVISGFSCKKCWSSPAWASFCRFAFQGLQCSTLGDSGTLHVPVVGTVRKSHTCACSCHFFESLCQNHSGQRLLPPPGGLFPGRCPMCP